jgi:hypothetical protein
VTHVLDLWWLIDFAVCLVIFQLGRWYEHDRAWIAGRNALRREQEQERIRRTSRIPILEPGDPGPIETEEVAPLWPHRRSHHGRPRPLYDQEEVDA